MNGVVLLEHAASLLACSPAMLSKWASNGRLPTVKINRLTRIRQDEIEAWVQLSKSTATNQKTVRKGGALTCPGQSGPRGMIDSVATREVRNRPWTRDTPEEILQHLRTVELDTCRKLGVTEQTYYRWKQDYSGLRVDQAKRLEALEQATLRLKRIVVNQALDLSILKEVASGIFSARPASMRPWGMPSPCSTCLSIERVGRSVSSGPPIGTSHGWTRVRSGCARGSSRSRRSTGGMGPYRGPSRSSKQLIRPMHCCLTL